MRVVIDASGVQLDDPADCRRFHVVHDKAVALTAALRDSGAGYAEDGDVMIEVSWLREQARDGVGAAWPADFAAMLEYAAGKGWLTPDGCHVRAHVEAP